MRACKGRFQPRSAVLVALQAITRIEYLHSKGFVHRDIKPENFLFGAREKQCHLYIIDYGLSKRYFTHKHADLKTGLNLTGTARYASINAHQGFEQSRRDDLEAIGHMLLYFLRGHLPWSGLDAKNKAEKYRLICKTKVETKLEELCQGFPDAFKRFLEYARNLHYLDKPDYNALRSMFDELRESPSLHEGAPLEDSSFEWNDGKELGELIPLQRPMAIQQPDERVKQVTSKGGFCGCFGQFRTQE